MRGGVTDAGRPTDRKVKVELLSQWKLQTEFRNLNLKLTLFQSVLMLSGCVLNIDLNIGRGRALFTCLLVMVLVRGGLGRLEIVPLLSTTPTSRFQLPASASSSGARFKIF